MGRKSREKWERRRPISIPIEPEEFGVDEAASLVGLEVMRQEQAFITRGLPDPRQVGVIVGLVAINDEVELLIKFEEGLIQIGRNQFEDDYALIAAAC